MGEVGGEVQPSPSPQDLMSWISLDGAAVADRAAANAMTEADVSAAHDAIAMESTTNGGIVNGDVTAYGERLERVADVVADREPSAVEG
jgi:hypothetical protein